MVRIKMVCVIADVQLLARIGCKCVVKKNFGDFFRILSPFHCIFTETNLFCDVFSNASDLINT